MLRVAFLLQSAAWSSLFAKAEQLRYGQKLKKTDPPRDPVFIVGHWRTGSTFLHQLMALDPAFQAPTLFQVALPDSFLISYPYYKPLFRCIVSKSRPMDNVRLGMDEPQEDEYAIFRLTGWSPLRALVFPSNSRYFLDHSYLYQPDQRRLNSWKTEVLAFFRKLHFHDTRRIVSKNPFHSFRIPLLVQMFPEAKFIHIVRHPDQVIPSSIHMWNILQDQNSLYRSEKPGIEDVTRIFSELVHCIWKSTASFQTGKLSEVRYEDLESDPMKTMEKIYNDLNLTYSEEYQIRMGTFLKEISGFKKNEFQLPEKDKGMIRQRLGDFMARYAYE